MCESSSILIILESMNAQLLIGVHNVLLLIDDKCSLIIMMKFQPIKIIKTLPLMSCYGLNDDITKEDWTVLFKFEWLLCAFRSAFIIFTIIYDYNSDLDHHTMLKVVQPSRQVVRSMKRCPRLLLDEWVIVSSAVMSIHLRPWSSLLHTVTTETEVKYRTILSRINCNPVP